MAAEIAVEPHAAGVRGVWALTLTHPGKFNAMSRSMWVDLRAAVQRIAQDPQARCLLVRGAQGHFCAGGDIAEYPAFRFDAQQLRAFHEEQVWGALQALLDCDLPIVAEIAGNCMGAGMEIASCCDLRLAAQTAQFGAPIARLGFPMAPREAALVAQAAGLTVARSMLLAAQVWDAPAMLARGFLTQVCAPADLAAHSAALVQRIAALAPAAARRNKQVLRALNQPPTQTGSALAAIDLIANGAMPSVGDPYAYADTPEHREGIGAFLAKRAPVFGPF